MLIGDNWIILSGKHLFASYLLSEDTNKYFNSAN
jgi:hypothetical protein